LLSPPDVARIWYCRGDPAGVAVAGPHRISDAPGTRAAPAWACRRSKVAVAGRLPPRLRRARLATGDRRGESGDGAQAPGGWRL